TLARLSAESKLSTAEGRKALLAEVDRDGPKCVLDGTDPLLALARGVCATRAIAQSENRAQQGRRLVVGPRWIEAQEAWRGGAFYPDANGTLRVSVATVRGYQPRDGATYQARTTVKGVLEKETGKEPFASPKALLQAAAARAKSRFVDPLLGDVPVC